MRNKLTLVAIFAHPDDEAFGTGGTLTKYVEEGVDVHLVMATLGEAGRVANPNITLTEPISVLRKQELQNACLCYGIDNLHLLGYTDGQTTIVPQNEPVHKLVTLLREIKPQVVVSFGPDGIYGHYDHLAIHRWATAAVQLAGDDQRWPEAGPPHTVPKLYYRAMPNETVEQLRQNNGRDFVLMDGVPFPFTGYPANQITTLINVREQARKKLQGLQCHASQFDPEHNPFMRDDFDPIANEWFWQETFMLAKPYSTVDALRRDDQKEDDFFAGLR
ncbi:MAG: PIG-L deacetylase family protein [Chloroflexota bacterium]